MTDIRTFIKNLGDNAPEFFDAKPATVTRWLKTGNVPMRAVQKILLAVEATKTSEPAPAQEQAPTPIPEPAIDPVTHLPSNLDRRLPAMQGRPPETIEINPLEQNFGNNLTRPGRVSDKPLPPMVIRKEGGVDVPYVPSQPKPPTVLPPSIPSGAGAWSKPYEVTSKDERTPEQKAEATRIPQEKV